MTIKDVRVKYPQYKISYLPKKNYIIGVDPKRTNIRMNIQYDEVFIARHDNEYYLLYPHTNNLTGSFDTREKVIEWFAKGGR